VSRRGGVEQILYTLSSPAKQIVPITEPSWIVDGSTTSAVSASGGGVSTSLSGLPVNILSAAALTAPSVLIHANGTRTATAIRWPAAEGCSYTLQVFDKSGKLLTTLPRVYLGPGIASASWDGSIGGKVVALGSYRLIVVLTGVDGRVTKLGKSVTVVAG
jgi:hypothetical protein